MVHRLTQGSQRGFAKQFQSASGLLAVRVVAAAKPSDPIRRRFLCGCGRKRRQDQDQGDQRGNASHDLMPNVGEDLYLVCLAMTASESYPTNPLTRLTNTLGLFRAKEAHPRW